MIVVHWISSGIVIERDGDRLILNREGNVFAGELDLDSVEFCGNCELFIGTIVCDETRYFLFVVEVSNAGYFSSSQGNKPILRIERVRAVPTNASAATIKQLLSKETNTSAKLKNGTEKILKFVQDKIVTPSGGMIDQILRLFNDVPDFYYCIGRDITLCTQRYFNTDEPKSDEQFFWNRFLLKKILDSQLSEHQKKIWCIPIVQGFVSTVELSLQEDPQVPTTLQLTLISRRSVRRAGARYLRRGIDSTGNVANFVETEVIVNIFDHHLSFVQIRGSVPLFWSQKGFKYRPPLLIDRSVSETLELSKSHFERLQENYGTPMIAINLVDQTGRELHLAKSYLEVGPTFNFFRDLTNLFPLAIKLSLPELVFVSFDLHKHCRGLKFDKINVLVGKLTETLNCIGYCWVDKTGNIVRRQSGIVRMNCVDCLDRTNVVQSAISQYICMQQAQRLGIFGPLSEPPDVLVNVLQTMWADNGDAVSTQYAGTAALKGDVTRSGERKLTGIMKDGYNSASRYYLSHTRDSMRQRAMNLLLGVPDQGNESMAESESDSDEDDNLSRLVNETIHFLLPEKEVVVGGWGLINGKQRSEMVDSVIILTRTKMYVALYDDEAEKLIDVSIVSITDLELLEIGCTSRSPILHLRLTAKNISEPWIWRPGRTRLFNSIPIRLKTAEEANEYLESIAEQIRVSYISAVDSDLPFTRLDRLTSNNTTARAALSSMKSLFRVRAKRSSPSRKSKSEYNEDSGMCTPQGEEPVAASCSNRFGDDMDIKLGPPIDFHSSASEGRLDNASNFTSRLRALRPSQKPDSKEITTPFAHLLPLIDSSKTKFLLL